MCPLQRLAFVGWKMQEGGEKAISLWSRPFEPVFGGREERMWGVTP